MKNSFAAHLPVSAEECRKRGWDQVDIVLVTGDAYVDHPSFGVALLSRLLEKNGYRVAILAQPRFDTCNDFKQFGKPRLFFGITAGNLDSIVANYTSHGKVRDVDAYSKDGNPWHQGEQSKANRRRPDRASLLYAQLARQAYRDVPIILGGVEASLRRFVHFDYRQSRLRSSLLTDAKADLLVYGMGEKATLSIAERLESGQDLLGIKGTCVRLSPSQFSDFQQETPAEEMVFLPSLQEISTATPRFMTAELCIDSHARSCSSQILIQKQQSSYVVQFPQAPLLTEQELDDLYALPFTRKPHPLAGDIPAYRMIRHSVTIVRGCSGNCSFCAITRHQGPMVTSRSQSSILSEIRHITEMDDFKGTISDLGGPTANLYGTSCALTTCKRHDCLFPAVCRNLKTHEEKLIALLDAVLAIDKVQHVFISSGLRMELLLNTPKLLRKLIASHTPGALKIAPEHTEPEQLQLMHKEKHAILRTFVATCRQEARQLGRRLQLTPYVITGHPGSCEEDSRKLARKMKELGLTVRQFQDFTPTPGTLSTAMYVSGIDTKGKKLHLPAEAEKKRQRSIIEQTFLKTANQQKKQKKR